jgi:hypothetical protein
MATRRASTYQGKHPTKGYHLYGLVVDRPDEELDFRPLGGELGPELSEGPTDPDDAGFLGPYAREVVRRAPPHPSPL